MVIPSTLNVDFILGFKELILQRVKKGERFIIIVGGGSLARSYQKALEAIGVTSSKEKDYIGIQATYMNAVFMRQAFGRYASNDFLEDPYKKVDFSQSVLFGGGYEPGYSTDMVAVAVAQTYKIDTMINISNVKKIYDADPRTHAEAKPLDRISWSELRRMIGSSWTPGMNTPFDPIAAKAGQKYGLRVVAIGGDDLNNLSDFFDDRTFEGTIIEP